MKLIELTREEVIEIVKLAFGEPDWITSEIDVSYQPYIEQHYEDAREYQLAKFTAYFAGNKTTQYRVEISSTLDVWLWYFENGSNHLLGCRNQRAIQQKFTEFGF